MPILNRIAGLADEMTAWRRELHRMPELRFDLPRTAGFVAERLREFGVDEIHEGIAETGIVAIIEGRGQGPVIGLRADMDALPMQEQSGADWASQSPGAMHACGHDGHTVMLLGAAQYLCETRNFAGRVALIFQPAEEGGGGAGVMVESGVLERFDISEIYALHNAPGTPVGQFYTNPGPIMAAVDTFEITVQGTGGHAAYPHETRDPITAAAAMVGAIQTIASRAAHPLADLVVAVTQFHSGSADNVTPGEAWLQGTVRTFEADVQQMVRDRLAAIVAAQADSYGVAARLDYEVGYPATINDAEKTAFAVEVAREIAGPDGVDAQGPVEMGAEDFAYFLQHRPGAYLFVGNGDSAGLHHPAYDFNDETAAYGASFFARLVERALPLE